MKIKEMIQRIKKQLIKQVEETEWLDEITKRVSEDKLNLIKSHVGGNDILFEENFEKIVNFEGVFQTILFQNHYLTPFQFQFSNDNILEMVRILNRKKYDSFFHDINRNIKETRTRSFKLEPNLQTRIVYNPTYNTLSLKL